MKIALACDQGGFHFKQILIPFLQKIGHEINDFGCDSEESVDYPDFGVQAVQAVAAKQADRAILICGTGIGMSMLANRFPGIFATLVYNESTARLSREHNNSNVLCLGGREFSCHNLLNMVKIWLETEFKGEERHVRRLKKIH